MCSLPQLLPPQALELSLLFWLQSFFENQAEHFSVSRFLVCVFHIKVIPLEQKLAVEWCCHLIQSCWLYCSRFLTWVGWHPNQKLLSLTRPDWNHTCALLASCIVRISDFKAVGEGTVGGPMPVSLEAFTVPEASLCVKGYVQLTSPHLVVIGVPWIAEWLHSWGGSIEVVSEN